MPDEDKDSAEGNLKSGNRKIPLYTLIQIFYVICESHEPIPMGDFQVVYLIHHVVHSIESDDTINYGTTLSSKITNRF
jgi:hypothetical protein